LKGGAVEGAEVGELAADAHGNLKPSPAASAL
jgi:hypothetical protein